MSAGSVITLGLGSGFSNVSYLVTLGLGDYLQDSAIASSSGGVGSGRKRRWQAEYKNAVYEFNTAEQARQFLISLQQTHKPTRAERKARKIAPILTPRVEFTVDDVPVNNLMFDGMDALSAIYAADIHRLEMLEAAVNRQIAERDDEEALLWLA